MPTIFLIRHGETHWNRESRIQGHGDSPLTLRGIEQAKAYGRTLSSLFDDPTEWRIVSSPSPRCVQTAAIVCEIAGLNFGAITLEPRLMEVCTGEFSGRLRAELPASHQTGHCLDAWYFRCPGGETHAQVLERVRSWLSQQVTGEKLLVIGHGLSGRILRGVYAGRDPEESLRGDTPQDVVFRLSQGTVERIQCTPAEQNGEGSVRAVNNQVV